MASGSGGRVSLSRCAILLAGALVSSSIPAAPAWSQDLSEEATNGRSLSAAKAAALERRLLDNPQDLAARAQLVGYYHASRGAHPRRHTEHVLWFIRNVPESEVLDNWSARITPRFDTDGYLEAKRTWRHLVQEEPDNVAILRHAAGFHASNEAAFAAGLLRRAESLEPSNPEWARELAELEWREARLFPEGRDPAGAARALVHFERAHDLSGAADRIDLLPDLALAALAAGEPDKARVHALGMLEASPHRRDRGDPLHYGTSSWVTSPWARTTSKKRGPGSSPPAAPGGDRSKGPRLRTWASRRYCSSAGNQRPCWNTSSCASTSGQRGRNA